MISPHILGAFDRGQIPAITCVNKSTLDLGCKFPQLVMALQTFVDKHYAPVWGTKCFLSHGPAITPGTWGMVFLDEPDVADAFGYHDVTPDGLPLSKIFVRLCKESKEPVSVTASHELAEMLVDPGIQLLAMNQDGMIYAYETADADQDTHFLVNGLPMTNFVYPSWFEGFRKPRSTQFDYMKRIDRPFKIMPGGYMSIFKGGRWRNIFGSKRAEKKFKLEEHSRARTRLTSRGLSVL